MVSPASRVFVKEEENRCPISLENLDALGKKGELVVSECGHKFDRASIVKWIKTPRKGDPPCPLCKQTLVIKGLAVDQLQDFSSLSSKVVQPEYGHQNLYILGVTNNPAFYDLVRIMRGLD